VTIALLVANVFIYFFLQEGRWELTTSNTGQWPIQDYAAVPCELSDRCPSQGAVDDYTTVLTAMFMHGGLLHLGGNMLFLWIFGNNVEDAMGSVKYLLFYLLGGVAAMALQTVIDLGADVPTLGASGAVSAVLGAYIVLHPRARIVTLIFIILFFTIIELPRCSSSACGSPSSSSSARWTTRRPATAGRRRVLRAHRRLRVRPACVTLSRPDDARPSRPYPCEPNPILHSPRSS
jgi:membrane associated rhomboid family serine protease